MNRINRRLSMRCRIGRWALALAALLFGMTGEVAAQEESTASTASGQPDVSFERTLKQGNQAVRDGEFDRAGTLYSKLRLKQPANPLLNFNLGVVEFHQKRWDDALDSFDRAATSDDIGLVAKAKFNSGNCYFARALESKEQQPTEAVAAAKVAISFYRQALRLDTEFLAARQNIELAAQLIRDLAQRPEESPPDSAQDPTSSQQEQPKQDAQEPSSDDPGSENSSPEKPENSKEEPPQSGDDSDAKAETGESQSDGTGDRQEQSGSQDGDTGSSSREDQASNKPGDPNPSDDDRDPASANHSDSSPDSSNQNHASDDASSNKSAEVPSEDEQQGSSSKDVPETGGEKQSGKPPKDGDLTTVNEGAENASREDAVAAGTPQPGQLTREEAMKLLQSIRDRDMQRRLRKQFRQRRNRVPVQRDW